MHSLAYFLFGIAGLIALTGGLVFTLINCPRVNPLVLLVVFIPLVLIWASFIGSHLPPGVSWLTGH